MRLCCWMQGARQRRSQAGGPGPQNPKAGRQPCGGDPIQIFIMNGINDDSPRSRRDRCRDRLAIGVQALLDPLLAKIRSNIDWRKAGIAVDAQVSRAHNTVHGGKRWADDRGIAIEGIESSRDFHAGMTAQGGIDLLEKEPRRDRL